MHNAAGSVEAKGAASCEHDRVDFFYQVYGAEQVSFTRCWCTSTDIDAANGGVIAQEDSAAGGRFQVCVMSQAKAWDIGDVVMHT
jgi:hypothetical protein